MVIVTIIGLLALFALISYRLGTDDGGQKAPHRDSETLFWLQFGNH